MMPWPMGERELERHEGGRVVADCEGISADDDGGDRSKVVRVQGLGRGAAESMLGGVMPRGALCGLGERLKEEDHGR